MPVIRKNVPGATVELFLGTVKIAATVTGGNGNYSFEEVENGSYNIVVTKDNGKTKTEMVTINDSSATVNVELPVSEINSKVEHKGNEVSGAKSDISKTVAGGLDKVAEKHQPEKDGDKVTVKLTVEPKEDTNTPQQQAIKTEAGEGKKVEFLDLGLWMQTNDETPVDIGDKNDELLTIVIPFDFTNVNVTSVMILRNHGGKTTKLTKTPNEYGEYFVADEKAGIITLYAMKFSEYAIAYDMVHEHEWETDFTVDSKPTCTQNGSKSIHCKTCSEVKEVTSIPATGHSFGEWITVTSVTCSGGGSEKRVCSVCGYTETRNLDPAGHEWESDFTVDKEPTCKQDGSKSIHCKHCDTVKDSTVIPHTEHKWADETVVKEATKTEDGEKTYTCERCGEVKHVVIPKTGDAHKCIVHWFMIALLVLFVILFAVFTVLKKKLLTFIACGVCGVPAIVLAFFGGCTICTVFTVVNLVVIAAGVLFTVFRKNAPNDDDDRDNDKSEAEQQE